MHELLPGVIAVLGLIGLAAIVAPRIGLPPAVFLAIAGIGWALLPGLAPLEIAPRVVLSVFLPPLLYSEAWRASWHDFRRWLRPILSLAIGLVAFTILCVGLTAKSLMPELPWAVRRAVWEAETAELLRLRDAGKINDGDHQTLQLEIDREHTDLHPAEQV